MDISPTASILELSECSPGSAVKMGSHGDPGWAIVCLVSGQPDVRAVLNLSGDGAPSYAIYRQPSGLRVLAFDDKPRLELDPSGPYEPPAKDLFEANGAVICNTQGWFMNVQAEKDGRRHRGILDLMSMTFVNDAERVNNVGIFGKWTVLMGSPDIPHRPPIELYSFVWTPRSDQR